VCEATLEGVRTVPLFPYIGNHLIRVRRDPQLSGEQRYRLAMKAVLRLKMSYSVGQIVRLYFQSFQGFWNPSFKGIGTFGIGAVICSELYSNAYSMVTSRIVHDPTLSLATPAALSSTTVLADLQTRWLKIG
jgi:hypothetical protein